MAHDCCGSADDASDSSPELPDYVLELLEALGVSEYEQMDMGDGDFAIMATIKSKLAEKPSEDELSVFKAQAILASVISKDWKPFAGPRGGMGAYDPRSGQVEYGVNAERRIRMETSGRKVENPYLDLSELVMRLMAGTAHPEDLDQDQLLSVYNHVSEKIQLGASEPGYSELKNRLRAELGGRGAQQQVPEGR